MTERLRILIVEDVEPDAELELRELRRAGFACDARRVQTAADFKKALEEFQPRVILSDFSMPQFDGMEALRIARQSYPDIPFVFVSGTIGEEYAVRALKNGATDYVLKSNLIRLPVAVEKALKDQEERLARQALAEEVRASEKRYRQLFDSNPHPMWVYDIGTLRFLAVNDTAVARYGFSREEFLGMTIEDIRPEKERRRLRELVARRLPKVNESGTWQHQTKDGKRIDVEISSHDLLLEGRRARMVVAYDVTERRRAEEALRNSEERFRLLVEQAPEAIMVLDADTNRFVDANGNAERLFGCGRDELLKVGPQYFYSLEQPDGQPADKTFPEHSRRALAGEEVVFERAIHNAQGKDLVCEVRLVRFPSDRGQLVRASFIDISERKRAERGLRESEERFRQLAENIHEVFWMNSAETGECIYVSPAYEQVWGKPLGDLKDVHREWMQAVHPEDRERLLEQSRKLVAGTGMLDFQYRISRPDGSVRWIHDRGFPVPDAQGRIYRVAGIAEDITDRMHAEQQIRESETKYRQLIEQASDGIFVSDAEGNCILVNSRGCELLGYSESELLGMDAAETCLDEERKFHAERMQRVRAGEALRYERMVRRKDGSAFPADISMKMLDNGTIQVIFHDITLRRNQERKIARLSRIHAVLSGINSAIVRIRDRQELFREACRIAVENGGFRMAWVGMVNKATRRVEPVASAGFEDGFFRIFQRLSIEEGIFVGEGPVGHVIRSKAPLITNDLATDPNIFYNTEHLERGYRSGAVLPLLVGGEAAGLISLYASETGFFDEEECKLLSELAGDISFALEHIDKEEKLNFLAYYDVLTGLPNSTLFHDRLTQFVHAANRDNGIVAAIQINLDRFSRINDTLGRHTGDALLKMVAERLGGAVPDPASVARTAGDSFAIAVAGLKHEDEAANMIQDRVFPLLGQPFTLNGEEIGISAKAGVALYPHDGQDAETLFRNAEAALKQAKSSGERCVFYAPEMNARVAEKLALENKLRQAIEREEFVLHYQPKVYAMSGQVSGLEALIRWNDPQYGLVAPAQFIPLLEETGMILEAGNWAIRRAFDDCRAWRKKGLTPPRIAINVSPLQLRQKDFVDALKRTLDASQGDPNELELEITEGIIIQDIEGNVHKLRAIRDMGIQIAVDDFGTGYSSLSYLAKLPVTALKIDRSFVVTMIDSPESAVIVSSVVSLAHSLGLQVIAEGVETAQQLKFLKQLECDEIQGFLVSRAIPSAGVEEFLSPKEGQRPSRGGKKRPPGTR